MEDKEKSKRSMIILRVHKKFHKEIKVAAALRNISMSLMIHRAIYQYLRTTEEEIMKENT